MDTLTHALSGALLARATQRDGTRLPARTRAWVGFWAAAFPDSDFVLRFIDPLTYLTAHRGLTHSVWLLPLWALGLAVAFMGIYRRRYSWREFVGVCALGVGAHIIGDIITAFGTMVYAPFSDTRVAFPFTFIIDPYFTAIIAAGLAGAVAWRSRRVAAGALGVLIAYVGAQAWLHQRALDVGRDYAAKLQPAADVHALPQPLSPFHWMIVLEQPDSYRYAYVNLAPGAQPRVALAADGWWSRLYASYQPPPLAPWVRVSRFGDTPEQVALAREFWRHDVLAGYRWFAMLPALYRIDQDTATTCVWFQDLRFAMIGREMPFRYGACREREAWRAYQLVQGQRQPVTTD